MTFCRYDLCKPYQINKFSSKYTKENVKDFLWEKNTKGYLILICVISYTIHQFEEGRIRMKTLYKQETCIFYSTYIKNTALTFHM